MFTRLIAFFRAPEFPDDEVKTRRARALNALQLNMGAAILVLGGIGVIFFFVEKLITSAIVSMGLVATIIGMILNRQGKVKTAGFVMLAFLWTLTVMMTVLSSGMQSLDIMFFISGTVIAGIVLGAGGAYSYAGLCLLTGLGFILAGNAGVEFLQLFTFPPGTAWILLFINLVFTVVPLQVTLQNLSEAVIRARSNEERYRLIASVMSDYAFSVQYGPDGKIKDQWISGAFEGITGYTPQEYFERGGWLSIVHPDDLERDARDMAKLRANQNVVSELRIIRKDGDIRWVRSYGHPQWDEKGNQLARIYGAVQDITDRKRMEVQLHQRAEEVSLLYRLGLALSSEQDLYHALRAFVRELKQVMAVDAFHVGLYDEATGIFSYTLFLNLDEDLQPPPRNLRENPGLTWEVISGRKTLYLQDMDDLNAQHRHNAIIVVDVGIRSYIGIPLLLQERVIGVMSVQALQPAAYTKDQIRLLETIAAQVAITIARLGLLEQVQRELDERKQLVTELEKRNAESETLRESAAIVAASLEGAETLSLILDQIARVVPYMSASVQLIRGDVLEIVGSRGVDLVNQYIVTSFPINEDEPAYAVIQGKAPYVLYEDVQVSVSIFNKISHNNIRSWMAVPLKVKGRIIGIIALDHDRVGRFSQRDAELAVTYANQAAVALENSRLFSELQVELSLKQDLIGELESKNAELERFTYTVSHDLRSPLVTINGFLGYLERDAIDGNMEGFRRDIDRIIKATMRMDALLRDLLEISRIGRLVNKPQDVPFGDLINEALEIVLGRLEERGITLRISSLDEGHPEFPLVHVDRPRLIEVLQNLIDNAAKYMGDQQHPVIEIGMDGYADSNHPIFFVRDNGMGIAHDYHERIFRLFDKLDATTEGTGVGLALVKRIIEFHGGRIWVASKVGKGSTFYFTLESGKNRK